VRLRPAPDGPNRATGKTGYGRSLSSFLRVVVARTINSVMNAAKPAATKLAHAQRGINFSMSGIGIPMSRHTTAHEKAPPDEAGGEPIGRKESGGRVVPPDCIGTARVDSHWCRRLVSKSSDRDRRHPNRSERRQQFRNRLPEPHGQRSCRPSFSSSSLSPCTTWRPRLTFVSDGNPLRRLLIGSKKRAGLQRLH
jgi:hypothetical protein